MLSEQERKLLIQIRCYGLEEWLLEKLKTQDFFSEAFQGSHRSQREPGPSQLASVHPVLREKDR